MDVAHLGGVLGGGFHMDLGAARARGRPAETDERKGDEHAARVAGVEPCANQWQRDGGGEFDEPQCDGRFECDGRVCG